MGPPPARALPDNLRVAWPNPDFDSRDPRRLHLVLLVLLVASLIVARGDWRTRLIGAFTAALPPASAWMPGSIPALYRHGADLSACGETA